MYKARISILASPTKHKKAVQVLHTEGKTHTEEYDKWLDNIIGQTNPNKSGYNLITIIFLLVLGMGIVGLWLSVGERAVQWVMPSLEQIDERR